MFNKLPLYPQDPLFHLLGQCKRDPRPEKINLGIGVFTTETGEPFVMPSVRQAAEIVSRDNYNYLPIGGDPLFLASVGSLLFGDLWNPEAFSSQGTCGGTQAVALCKSVAQEAEIKHLLLAVPTWVNHKTIFQDFTTHSFPHLDANKNPNLVAYQQAITSVEQPTVLLLHGGPTHNPTGRNLSIADLTTLIPLIQSKPLFVVIDFAYWGLGDGLQEDATGVRLLMSQLENVAVALSFSKNATLYNQRTGALFIKSTQNKHITSVLRRAVRTTISNPPAMGENIMTHVITNTFDAWKNDVDTMRLSINHRRNEFVKQCPNLGFLNNTRGMFGLLGLQEEHIKKLETDFAMYLPLDGRINFGGLHTNRIPDLARALQLVTNAYCLREHDRNH